MKTTLSQKQLSFCRHYVRTRNGREAAAASGFLLFPEKAAQKLLSNPKIRAEISALEAECNATRAELIAGYRRLAFGSVADAVKLLLQSGSEACLDPDALDLFSVAEIKRPKAGGMEIKFFDRQKALDRLSELQSGNGDSALPFYRALEQSAALLRRNGDEL